MHYTKVIGVFEVDLIGETGVVLIKVKDTNENNLNPVNFNHKIILQKASVQEFDLAKFKIPFKTLNYAGFKILLALETPSAEIMSLVVIPKVVNQCGESLMKQISDSMYGISFDETTFRKKVSSLLQLDS
uniref:Uncharacterized protein n=1 Tax=Rhabditophanes sp. KR3021 TaxID=114890 RepID=A0AC35TTI9_9BILA